MRNKIFGALVVVAIAVGAMINVNLNKVSNKGDLALANVEALANEKDGKHEENGLGQYDGWIWHVISSHILQRNMWLSNFNKDFLTITYFKI